MTNGLALIGTMGTFLAQRPTPVLWAEPQHAPVLAHPPMQTLLRSVLWLRLLPPSVEVSTKPDEGMPQIFDNPRDW